LIGFGVAKGPGLFAGEIFVGGGDNGPDGFEGAGETEFVEIFEDFADGGLSFFGQSFVLRFQRAWLGILPAKFFR